jgi:FMN phosphatase YigB (HAD superfamily)
MTKLFVFDLGNVILPFEHRQIAAKLHQKSGHKKNLVPDELFQFIFGKTNGLVNAYEKGQISSFQFFTALRERFHLQIDYEEFKGIWNDIFRENPEMNKAVMYLKDKGYPLFLLSNVSELHFAYIIERYPLVHVFDEWILSFEVGAKKPEKRIYDVIFERMAVPAHEVFYIDDIPEFVETARGFGIKGMVFESTDQLWEALREQGI